MNFKKYHVSRNLWDEEYPNISPTIKYVPLYVGEGSFTLSSTTPLPPNGAACLFFFSGSVDSGAGPQNRVYHENPRTVDSIDGYVTIACRITSYDPRDYTTMLNSGSTPLPYEPYTSEVWHDIPHYIHNTSTDTITTLPADLYADGNNATVGILGNMSQTGTPTPQNPMQPSECGELETSGTKAGQYKIPISSAGQTTPVYLGEVQTTRRIKKLVLTGQENWTKNDAGNPSNYLYYQTGYLANKTCVCSHLVDMGTLSASKVGIFNGNNVLYLNFGSAIMNAQPSGNTIEGLKEYLAAQYSAGTPVTVWYVLATETTGIVNEPIRKIGDYADTVSGITIPTIAGADSFDVLTTLKPSEVSLSYTGWHDATVKEWDGSQWD